MHSFINQLILALFYFPTRISFSHNSYTYIFYFIVTYKLLQILSEMVFGIFKLIHNKKAIVLKEKQWQEGLHTQKLEGW